MKTDTAAKRTAKTCACAKREPYFTQREIRDWLNTPDSLAALAEARLWESRPPKGGAKTTLEILRMLHS